MRGFIKGAQETHFSIKFGLPTFIFRSAIFTVCWAKIFHSPYESDPTLLLKRSFSNKTIFCINGQLAFDSSHELHPEPFLHKPRKELPFCLTHVTCRMRFFVFYLHAWKHPCDYPWEHVLLVSGAEVRKREHEERTQQEEAANVNKRRHVMSIGGFFGPHPKASSRVLNVRPSKKAI